MDPVSASVLAEMLRYVGFGPDDEVALRRLAPAAAPHFPAIAEDFYDRLAAHDDARRVFADAAQIARLKGTLQAWLRLLLDGPWDEAYHQQRARIGRRHVEIELPQRYMFGAMNVIRLRLDAIARAAFADADDRAAALAALHKILDVELAIMLESYADASLEHQQRLERLEQERVFEQLDVRARRAERLASLGTMAAGLAHEIRNPLNAAQLQLTLAGRRLGRATPDVDGARDATGLAASEIQRLAGLVGEFLAFARPQPLRRGRVDLRETAGAVVALLEPQAEAAGVALTIETGGAVSAECDEEKIKQVLHNLVRNAIEATGPGGRVGIRIGVADGDAMIEVEDDGPGFAAHLPVFEPFFTTKAAGTGLGLSIVHRIVTDHGGSVDVRRRPGATVFAVSLPLQPA